MPPKHIEPHPSIVTTSSPGNLVRRHSKSIGQLQNECNQLRAIVQGFEDIEAMYRYLLNRESTAHAITRDCLRIERVNHMEVANMNKMLQRELSQKQAAQIAREVLLYEKRHHQAATTKLYHKQKPGPESLRRPHMMCGKGKVENTGEQRERKT
ncbi:hypothetical protein LOZ58_006887 [Ophidiomyces ophidiicola]|nr:hypothetical protein LOZ58_006887 [Ophidiomyces ophidiicola]